MITVKKLLEKLSYEVLKGSVDTEVTTLVYDSREVTDGSIFLCISGTKNDAHKYIPQAIKAGAKAIVVEKKVEVDADVTVIYVESARKALAFMSAAYFDYPADKMTTIGLTGTKGKTTTSYMIKMILECAGKKVGLIGTNGAWINGVHYETKNTTPESYELESFFKKMVDAGCDYMIMEVSSQGLKMHRVDGFSFDYALFTNISPDHIGPDEHADFDEYLNYKRKILNLCKVGYVNRDDEHFEEIVKDATCKVVTYGESEDANLRVTDIDYLRGDGYLGVSFSLNGQQIKVNMPGHFNAMNAAAAVSVCMHADVSNEVINEALAKVRVDGRMEIVHAGKFGVIVDYAHNAVSLESLLKTLRSYHPARLICVFGCGGNRSKLRRYDMGEISGKMADLSVITADNSRFEKVEDIIADIKIGMSKTNGKYVEIPDRREAIEYCIENAKEGDIIVIAGKGHEDYQEIEGVRHHFLDREEAKKALDKLEKEAK
ncbi:UDP-N-acetylmuramoylalanyl-D-glutamate--2,6- diaminopimelate ligase [Lachnospiraceae bacterium TWA4]|nr:UDP-N-acetylmuramoylalanyl-D-glutamate--2,6- diaminopimelate ligase [Lachnospiraceae bacterium TWA4]